jgi:hypothetical protein
MALGKGTKGPHGAGIQHTDRGPVQGIRLVGPSGEPIDARVDASGDLRLLVDANVTIGSAVVNVDLESDSDNVAIRNTANDNELLIQADGSITIRLKDESGVAYSNANPLPVEIVTATGIDMELDAADGDNIAISGHPNQLFQENTVNLTTATYTTLLTYVAGAANTNILFAEVSGTVEALVRVKLNGTVIRQKHVSAKTPSVEFPFSEPRRIGAGDTILIEAKARKAPPAFMSGGAEFFAALQGFVE